MFRIKCKRDRLRLVLNVTRRPLITGDRHCMHLAGDWLAAVGRNALITNQQRKDGVKSPHDMQPSIHPVAERLGL